MSSLPIETPKPTIVSPDVSNSTTPIVVNSGRVILIPMPEWKQCAQRGVRSFIQALTFLLGGGSIAVFAAQFGVAPDMVASMPTLGNKFADVVVFSALFGLICFLWNFIEFWLDVDVLWPKWRA